MEVWYPLFRFQEAGATVVTVGAKAGETYPGKLGYPVKCRLSYDDARVADFPMGRWFPGGYAPDRIRRHARGQPVREGRAGRGGYEAGGVHLPRSVGIVFRGRNVERPQGDRVSSPVETTS